MSQTGKQQGSDRAGASGSATGGRDRRNNTGRRDQSAVQLAGLEAGGFVQNVLKRLRTDANLLYLAERLQAYADSTESSLVGLRQAVSAGDCGTVIDLSRALTDSTARLGAVRVMRVCIAMQLLARRGYLPRIQVLMGELEQEYDRFKENLIWAVG